MNVNYIITGTSRIFGGEDLERVVLSIELIDAKANRRIWNSRYEEVLKGVPKIQLDIAKDIAFNLRVNLTSNEEESLNKVNTISGKAFQLFLKAKGEMSGMQIEGFDAAEANLLEAVTLDPNYAQAYTLLAWNYVLQGRSWYWRDHMAIEEARNRTKRNIEKAIEVNPESSDIYLVRANFNHTFEANLKAAIVDVENALEINSWPEIPTNYCICTAVTTYVMAGNLNRARELANLAGKIDPGSIFIYHDQGIIYMQE